MADASYDQIRRECSDLADRFANLVEVQKSLDGLDKKTRELISIAVNASMRNPDGVRHHAAMAHRAGATKEEIVGAVVMNLHLAGLVPVLDCLPAALDGIEKATRKTK